jgi:hypothetical protein
MKKIFVLALALLATQLSVMAGNKPFEGTLKYAMTFQGEQVEQYKSMLPTGFDWLFKGDFARMDMHGGMMALQMGKVVSTGKTGETFIVDDANKTVKVMEKPAAPDASQPKPKLINTGEVAEIAGYKCTKMKVASDTSANSPAVEIWIANDLTFPTSFNLKTNPMLGQLAEAGITNIPLRITMDQGPMKVSIEVVEVKKEKLPDTNFEKPKGYKEEKFDMNSMMGGE